MRRYQKNPKFVVVNFLNKQFKLTTEETFFYYTAPSLPYKVGEEIILDQIKLIGDLHNTYIGKPVYSKMYLVVKLIEKQSIAYPTRLNKKNHSIKKHRITQNKFLFKVKHCFFLSNELER